VGLVQAQLSIAMSSAQGKSKRECETNHFIQPLPNVLSEIYNFTGILQNKYSGIHDIYVAWAILIDRLPHESIGPAIPIDRQPHDFFLYFAVSRKIIFFLLCIPFIIFALLISPALVLTQMRGH